MESSAEANWFKRKNGSGGPTTMTEDPEYKPTDEERAALDRQAQRQKESSAAPRYAVVNDYRGTRVELDHPDPVIARALLREALGTASDAFCDGVLRQLFIFVDIDDSDWAEIDLNFLIASVIGGKPKHEQHTQLLVQMSIVLLMQTKFARNYDQAERLFEQVKKDLKQKDNPYTVASAAAVVKNLSLLLDSYERGANRFARTFCQQLEALERCRGSGAPSMTVQQQVTVGLVGNLTNAKVANDPAVDPQALSDQRQSAAPLIDGPSERDREELPLRRRKTR
jgi:hypothetical protein